MNKENSKKGSSCITKKDKKFESPKVKIARYKSNIVSIYKRAKYGFCDKDVWAIDCWFLSVMPAMLEQLKETTHGYPISDEAEVHAISEIGTVPEDKGLEKWKEILSEMIFMLCEADEDTCTRVNPYEKEYDNLLIDYLTRDYPNKDEINKTHPVKLACNVSEEDSDNLELTNKYFAEESKLNKYRNGCKNRGLELFSKWFWQLWD